MIIVEGKIIDFLLLIIFTAVVLYSLYRKSQGHVAEIRRLAACDAIDEAIGRAVETNRPTFFTPFFSTLADDRAPQTIAGLSVLDYVAHECAKKGSRLITLYNWADSGPLIDSILSQAYFAEGVPEDYNRERDLIFQPRYSSAFGSIDLIKRENVGSAIMIGYAFYSSVLVSSVIKQIGAFTISGTAHISMLAFFVGASDYVLLGEEIYAAGAYLSKNETTLSTLEAQDINKYITLILILISMVVFNLGFSGILNILNM